MYASLHQLANKPECTLEVESRGLRRTPAFTSSTSFLRSTFQERYAQETIPNIKSYTIKKLLVYKNETKNKQKQNIVEETINRISKCREGNSKEILEILTELWGKLSDNQLPSMSCSCEQKDRSEKNTAQHGHAIHSRTLSRLILHLKTQITHVQYLTSIGESEINTRSVPLQKTSQPGTSVTQQLSKINFNKLSIIFVTGARINPYGHALLKLGDAGYLQINGVNELPEYLPDDKSFSDYLIKNKSHIQYIQELDITHTKAAQKALEMTTQKKWFWRLTYHNCLSFVHFIAIAGGMSLTDLGYGTPEFHTESQLPLNFITRVENNLKIRAGKLDQQVTQQEKPEQSPENSTEYYAKQIEELCQQDPIVRHRNDVKEMADYYATLRQNGLSKNDAREFLGLAYDLKPEFLNKLVSSPKQVLHAIKASTVGLLNNFSVIPKVVKFGITGDKRVEPNIAQISESLPRNGV